VPAPLESGTEFVAPRNRPRPGSPTSGANSRLDQISIHDNFFALGGHSCWLCVWCSVFRRPLGQPAGEAGFRVSHLVGWRGRWPDRRRQDRCPAPQLRSAAGKPVRCPASFSQEQLWFIDQLEPGSAVYNVPLALRLKGELDLPRLTESLNRVIARHDALRTVFVAEQGVPVQVVLPELKLALA